MAVKKETKKVVKKVAAKKPAVKKVVKKQTACKGCPKRVCKTQKVSVSTTTSAIKEKKSFWTKVAEFLGF